MTLNVKVQQNVPTVGKATMLTPRYVKFGIMKRDTQGKID